jgi:predicted nucleic acid-binding protein
MNGQVFVDASAWFAVSNPRGSRYGEAQDALAALQAEHAEFLTTSLVIAEIHALLTGRLHPAAALSVLDGTAADPAFTIVHVDPELQAAAVDRWLRVYRDQAFSLCDAVSFEVMRRERISRAFTLDHHFAVAGFTMIPGPPVIKGRQPRTRR